MKPIPTMIEACQPTGENQRTLALVESTAVVVDSSPFGKVIARDKGCVKRILAFYKTLKQETVKADGRKVLLVVSGFDKLGSHAGDNRTLRIVAGIKALLHNATPLWADPDRGSGNHNVHRWITYAVQAKLDGELVLVKLVVREECNGKAYLNLFDDASVTPVADIKKALDRGFPISIRGQTGLRLLLAPDLAKDRLCCWYIAVKGKSLAHETVKVAEKPLGEVSQILVAREGKTYVHTFNKPLPKLLSADAPGVLVIHGRFKLNPEGFIVG